MSVRPPSATTRNEADRFFDCDDVRLRYRDEGRGPPIILLHGWTFDLEMWDPQVAALRDEFRLVRFDRRGHGYSGGLPDSGQDAADLDALCRHLRLSEVALLGMSQGARGVLRFASQNPERVTAVILDGPPSLDQQAVDDDVPMHRFREQVRTGGLQAFRREWREHALVQLCTESPALLRQVHAMIERYPGRELLAPVAAAATTAPLSLEAIKSPALILSGAYDLPSRLQSARELASRLPQAQLMVLPDAGHLINLDQPALYSRVCRAFLTSHPGRQ